MDVKAILPLFSRLPRPVLVLLALAGAGYAAQREVSWRQDVGEHITAAVDGYQRLGAVERGQSEQREQIRELRDELRQQRMDQLSFYRNWAEDRGYRDAQRHYEQRLRELKEKK